VTEKKTTTIGYDRYIEREWLDQAAEWASSGVERAELYAKLNDFLTDRVHGNHSKKLTRTLLLGIWSAKTIATQEYFQRACELWPDANNSERLALHWGLSVANYPFFASLVRLIGRLDRLQGDIHSRELVRRSVELHGDTESVRRATTRLLQSLAQWQLLKLEKTSLFRVNKKREVHNAELLSWLFASVFFSSDRQRLAVREILTDPLWFPFQFEPSSVQITQSGLVEIVYRGPTDNLAGLSMAR
jgi:hypothetical protein